MPKPFQSPAPVASPAPQAPTVEPADKPATPANRIFTAKYKLRIVREANACTERGQIEALLRREGLYSSLLASWRKAFRLYGEKGLPQRHPGRKPSRDERDLRIERLEQDNARLLKDLALAQKIVELQKKVSELLGIVPPPSDEP